MKWIKHVPLLRLRTYHLLLPLVLAALFLTPLPLHCEEFIVAKVNKKAITNSELTDRYRFVITASKIRISSEQDKKLLLGQILEKMVDEELIRQEAEGLKLEISPNEMREAIDEMAAQQKKNATQFKIFFISNGLSFENYLKQLESEILWSKIIGEVVRPKAKISEAEVREFLEQKKISTDVKKFFIAEILISPSQHAEKLANKLAAELNHGADFLNIVKQFSSAVNAEHGGEIGWVSQADINEKIYNSISKLSKGKYSEPLLLADGYHIFKLLDIKIETKIDDQDMKLARDAIFSRKIQNLAKGYLMELRKKGFVEKS